MQSDMDALKQTGGTGPAPKPFTPPELIRDFSRPSAPPPPPSPIMPKITPSDFTTPKPASAISPSGPVTLKPVIEEEKPAHDMKKILLWSGAFGLIIGAGAAGYLIVYPMLFPALPVPPPPPPAITVPTVTETPAITESPEIDLPLAPRPHASLLTASDSVSPNALIAADLTSLKSILTQEGQKTLAAGSLAEIMLNDAGGQVPSSAILPLIFPELSSDSVRNLLADDFTVAMFYDANGAWPAYIFKLSENSSILEGQAATAALEASTNLGNMFTEDPGAPNPGGFKTGQVSGTATRYLPFEKTGASLNIAWTKDKLVISASYNGLKKILTNLAQ